MRPNLEIIDNYLKGELSDSEKLTVEKQIATDKEFAKDFTLMHMAHKAAKELADAQRKKDFESLQSGLELQNKSNVFLQNNKIKWAAAASIALIISFFWIFNTGENSGNLANNYIKNHLTELPVMMGNSKDSLQLGIDSYNKKEYQLATNIFEKLANKEPKAQEYLGLALLQMEKYDDAITIFEKLSQNELYKSRAKVLEALSLIKKGDKVKSYEIIKSINKKDLSVEDREFIEGWVLASN